MTETRQTGEGMKPWVLPEVSYFIMQVLDDLVHVRVVTLVPVLLPQADGDGEELILDHH